MDLLNKSPGFTFTRLHVRITDLSGVEVPILVAKDLSEPPLVRDLPGPVHGLPQQLLCSNVYAVACPNYSGGRRLHGERPDAQSFK